MPQQPLSFEPVCWTTKALPCHAVVVRPRTHSFGLHIIGRVSGIIVAGWLARGIRCCRCL